MSPTNTCSRTSDENALRAKVDEAMSVYDEYIKNKDGEGQTGDAKDESKA